MQLLVVIVNYRSAALTKDALSSLVPALCALPSSHVMVVDNASGDDSVADLYSFLLGEPKLAKRVTLFESPRNGGFSAGNNAGIRHWMKDHPAPEYVLLLNPDTVVRPNAIEGLVAFMEGHPDVGIAGSRLEDPDGTPQCSSFRFPSVASEFESALSFGPIRKLLSRWVIAPPVPDENTSTDWVAGACMMIRWKVFEDVGFMDESYFMYFEEVDFCLQAKRAGFSIWYVPSCRVVHLVGQVSQVTDRKQAHRRRPQYWFDSRRRYFVKNHGRTVAAMADVGHIAGHLLNRARRFVERKPRDFPERFARDFLANSVLKRGFSDMADGEEERRSLLEQIREDYQAHGRDWTKPGFQAVLVHRFGNWRMGIEPKAARAAAGAVYRSLYCFVRNVYGIELPHSAKVGRRVVFEHQGDIVVHGNAVLGDDCIIRQGVTIGNRRMNRPFDAPTLGAGVNVGAGAKILGKITIGDNANVGANAVVMRDVGANDSVVGIPARPVSRTSTEPPPPSMTQPCDHEDIVSESGTSSWPRSR